MTTSLSVLSKSSRTALQARLADLKAQRAQAAVESIPQSGTGDAADHAGNIDALIRLGELDSRIADLEVQLQAPIIEAADPLEAAVGSQVVLRFGPDEEPETFLIGRVEQASTGIEVITPNSPLGSVLIGAHPGDAVTYRAANGKTISVTLVSVGA
ncbi:GreA/GreB family elongation factor [Jatrophihabitans sp. DSM 45814]